MARSTQEVFDDHLRLRLEGDLESDLKRNYAEDCVLLTGFGVFHGHQGVREGARRLDCELPGARFQYRTRLTHGEIAFLEWTAKADDSRVCDGADSFLIRDGSIRVATIHYTIREEP